MQDIDEIYNILDKRKLYPERYGNEEFKRNISFISQNKLHTIQWWQNIAYLTIGEEFSNYIPFTLMEYNTTWPSCVDCLKFCNKGEMVAIVAINILPWQKR